MSKKRKKDALKFILNNNIILHKIADALGCERKMSDKERKIIVKDMIKTYAEENCTDSFTVNMFGPGEKKWGFGGGRSDYRNDRWDENWDVEKPKYSKPPKTVEDLIFK